MILWTPMQLELVLEGMEKTPPSDYSRISHQGIPMIVEKTGSGQFRIVQLLSTDPADYLKTEYCPGTVLETMM